MDGDNIRLPEQLVLRDQLGADFSRALGGEILAPGDHLHAEGVADPRYRAADVAETHNSERPADHVITDRLLPSAPRSDMFSATRLRAPPRMRAQVSSIRMKDLHAPLFCSLEIDRGVPASLDNQVQ